MLKPPNNVYFKVYLYELAQPRIQTVHFGIDLSDLASLARSALAQIKQQLWANLYDHVNASRRFLLIYVMHVLTMMATCILVTLQNAD